MPFISFGFKFHFSVGFFSVLLIKIQIHRITPTLYLNCTIPTGCIVRRVFILTEFNMKITSTLSLASTYTLSTCCKISHSNQMQCNACVSSTVYRLPKGTILVFVIVHCYLYRKSVIRAAVWALWDYFSFETIFHIYNKCGCCCCWSVYFVACFSAYDQLLLWVRCFFFSRNVLFLFLFSLHTIYHVPIGMQ